MGLFSWLFMKMCAVPETSAELLLNFTKVMDIPIVNTYLHFDYTDLESGYAAVFAASLISSLPTLLAVICGAVLIYLAFTPLNRDKGVSDVGWEFMQENNNDGFLSYIPFTSPKTKLSGRKLADKINRLQKLRKAGVLPPVYPNGWFVVEESRNLAIGQVVSVQVLGHNLAVFRGSTGTVMAVDAYCPHLGANLAAGGVVKGNCIECPFHGWQFDGTDGKCKTIPYTAKIPDFAKVNNYPTRDLNGFIFVWFDAENRDPSWEVPEIPDVTSGYWRYRGRTKHEILAHIQEIPENGADMAHLGHLHVPSVFKGANLNEVFTESKMDFCTHQWSGSWQACEGDESHIAKVKIFHHVVFKAFGFKFLPTNVEISQIGPGLVHLFFDTPIGKGVMVQTVTPLEPLRQLVYHHIYTSPMWITPIAKIALYSEANHFERDITVWNSKQYLHKPMLMAEDKLIKKYRTWYQQFYSENSPRLGDIESKDSMDW